MFHTIDVTTSGLVAQRQRMNTIASNIANVDVTQQPDGTISPFQRRFVTFQADESTFPGRGVGVRYQVEVDTWSQPRVVPQPEHPHADENGNVAYPNIKLVTEFVNAIDATRAYQANLSALQMTTRMMQQSLDILS